MKKTVLLLFCLSTLVVQAQTFNAGIRIQKTQGMYWENGLTTQFSFKNFAPNRFYLGFDYVTSRLGSAMGTNAIKQDNFILSGSWFFKNEKPFRFHVRLNAGYFYSDLEYEIFDEIPNTAFLLSPEIGFNYSFKNLPIVLNLGSGYYIDFAEEGQSPGTFQPLYYHLDISYKIFKNTTNE